MKDLIIIGGGPAGLSAAINAASEGLKVELLDNGQQIGGQAKESHAIENYPGFPEGITGHGLMTRLSTQAAKFETKFICPVLVQSIHKSKDGIHVLTDDYAEHVGKAVLIATGLQYRRHHAEGLSDLLGRGINYGMPVGAIPRNKTCTVVVVGGANSAGQAVVKLSENQNMRIIMVIRKTLEAQMSDYLVRRIRNCERIQVLENSEVTRVFKSPKGDHLGDVQINGKDHYHCQWMFLFIGAVPKTVWLRGTDISLDKDNYVHTTLEPYMTTMRGVFAAGDVRSGSVKRIAASSGEGSSVVPYIHRYLAA